MALKLGDGHTQHAVQLYLLYVVMLSVSLWNIGPCILHSQLHCNFVGILICMQPLTRVVDYSKEVTLFSSSAQVYFVFQWVWIFAFLEPF